MATEGYSLKDELFNRATITQAANRIKNVYQPFDQQGFIEEASKGIEPLELKERMAYVASLLDAYIELPYPEVLKVFCEAVKGESDGQFIYGSFQDYIWMNGCNDDFLQVSLETMGLLTAYFSAEFAIRPFINKYPKETLKWMAIWSKSDNYHQRRLASEGLRPKLPWAMGINLDYQEGAKYLDYLYYDDERYVTRSVANHLNDISKMEPKYVIDRLKLWTDSEKQEPKEMAYIISHALRTLMKKGDSDALELLGYRSDAAIEVGPVNIEESQIKIGQRLVFEFEIKALSHEQLMIDYQITYPMAKGKTSTKVFKVKKLSLKEGESRLITKKHMFKVMTTKKLYSGVYSLALQINGTLYPAVEFRLDVE